MPRRHSLLPAIATVGLICLGSSAADAACALPFTLTNGQVADATQVMANFNALVACLSAAAPGGGTNAVQYNAGSGTLGGVGPLTDGQLVIGSTSGAPQAGTLTAGAGITVTNAPGGITISTTGGLLGTGLYRQVMSATPTSTNTGLTTWLNQGSSVLTESATGLSINAPAQSGDIVVGRITPAPTPPYTITALIASTRVTTFFGGVCLGWYDGTNKLHLISLTNVNDSVPRIEVEKWNSPTSSGTSNDYQSPANGFPQPIWFQLKDDGTNVSFAFSQDGANFLQVFTVAKASGWLGAGGYNDLVFCTDAKGGQTLATLMSWTQN